MRLLCTLPIMVLPWKLAINACSAHKPLNTFFVLPLIDIHTHAHTTHTVAPDHGVQDHGN